MSQVKNNLWSPHTNTINFNLSKMMGVNDDDNSFVDFGQLVSLQTLSFS